MDYEVRRAIGGRLRAFRISLKLTQVGMARLLQVERQSVSAWETGSTMPKCEVWYRLGLMGMSLDYAVLGIRTMPVSDYAVAPRPCPDPKPCITAPAVAPSP